MVYLHKVNEGSAGIIAAKLESLEPCSSVKDRYAKTQILLGLGFRIQNYTLHFAEVYIECQGFAHNLSFKYIILMFKYTVYTNIKCQGLKYVQERMSEGNHPF